MSKVFYHGTNTKITYRELFADLEKQEFFNKYCNSASFYDVFKQILLSLITGEEIVLLDYDLTKNELKNLFGKKYNNKNSQKKICIKGRITYKNFIDKIKTNHSKWKVTLFSSGTTGKPKNISHTYNSLTRFVKQNDTQKKSTWGFAYTPTHMAGLQVFFQAIINQNTIVKLFGLKRKIILKRIKDFKVTNISATPTFFRLLLPLNSHYNTIKHLTSGGEKFDVNTFEKLKKMFPNAKIRNIYASTEAGSLLISDGNIFYLKSEYKNLIKIKKNELFINNSLIGESNLTKNSQNWYATGDIVSIISYEPLSFKFVSRKNEIVNVGGYNVNLAEVEDTIRSLNGIQDSIVFSKKNNLIGNIICCQVSLLNKDLTEKAIRASLRETLQEYKIPRIINIVNDILTGKTGKAKRII